MKVAVLMSTYNGVAFLQQQIESVLSQQDDFELDLWVRDDGSRDGTQRILEEYAAAGKLRWYTGDNLKPAKSFMDLVLHCPGYDYYAFADQDDLWLPGKLAAGIRQLNSRNAPSLYFANASLVDGQLNSLGRDVYKVSPRLDLATLSCAGGLLGCTMIFNRPLATLLQACPMPDAMVMHDFYIALVCALAGGDIIYDNTPRMLYRQHGSNVVGASHSKLSALKDRLQSITHRSAVSISEQAAAVLKQYPSLGTTEQRKWLEKLADQRFFNRLSVAFSSKTRYSNTNKSITLRLAILFGNR